MTSSNVNNSIYDALFKQAIIDNFNDELDSYVPDSESIKQYTYSPEHERRMDALFAKEERKENLRNVIKWSKKIAAALIITISILFGSLMFVSEVRAVVIDTVIEWYDQFVRFTSRESDAEKTNFEPSYIPDGFREETRDGDDMTTFILYTNNKGILIYFESGLVSDQLSIDIEEYDHEVMQLESAVYHIFTTDTKGKMNSISWEQSGQRYHLSSEISVVELLKIAISVGNK